MILNEDRLNEIKRLSLHPQIERLTQGFGKDIHFELEFCCRELNYSLDEDLFSPGIEDFIPLWEGHSSVTGFFWEKDKPIFVRCEIEEPENFKHLGSSEKELLVHLFRREIDEEVAEEVAQALHIKDIKSLIDEAYDVDTIC